MHRAPLGPVPGRLRGALLPSTAGKLPLAAGRGLQPPRGVRPAAGAGPAAGRPSEGWGSTCRGALRSRGSAEDSGGARGRSPGTCGEPGLERGSERQPPVGALPAAALSCAGRAGRLQPGAAAIAPPEPAQPLGFVLPVHTRPRVTQGLLFKTDPARECR